MMSQVAESKELSKMETDDDQRRIDLVDRSMPDSRARRLIQGNLGRLHEHLVGRLTDIIEKVSQNDMTVDEASMTATATMATVFDAAVRQGYIAVGTPSWEHTSRQEEMLDRYLTAESQFFTRFVGSLEGMHSRLALYGGATEGAFWRGFLSNLPSTSTIEWRLGISEHCCAPETLVRMADGSEMTIDRVEAGDMVATAQGQRRVTRSRGRWYYGELSQVGRLRCTPEHRIATRSGWKRACDVLEADTIHLEDCSEMLTRHLALPDTNNVIPTTPQIFIAGAVTSLLGLLAFCERLKPGMPVPVVTVGLKDDCADPEIDDELRLDLDLGFVIDTKRIEELRSEYLKPAGAVFHVASGSIEDDSPRRLWILGVPTSDASPTFGCARGVVVSHVIGGDGMDESVTSLIEENYPKLVRAVSHGLQRLLENLGDVLGTMFRIQIANDLVVVLSPNRAALSAVGAFSVISHDAATGTPATEDVDLFANQTLVATQKRAEAGESSFARQASARGVHLDLRSAILAGERHLVYDLTVEGAEHFVADGIIIHNCPDCLSLAAASPYNKPGRGSNPISTVPRNGSTRCLGNCRCNLVSGQNKLLNQIGIEVIAIGALVINPSEPAAIAAASTFRGMVEDYAYLRRRGFLEPAGIWSGQAAVVLNDIEALAESFGQTVRLEANDDEILNPVRTATRLGQRHIRPEMLDDDLIDSFAGILVSDRVDRGKITSIEQSVVELDDDPDRTYRVDRQGRAFLFMER